MQANALSIGTLQQRFAGVSTRRPPEGEEFIAITPPGDNGKGPLYYVTNDGGGQDLDEFRAIENQIQNGAGFNDPDLKARYNWLTKPLVGVVRSVIEAYNALRAEFVRRAN